MNSSDPSRHICFIKSAGQSKTDKPKRQIARIAITYIYFILLLKLGCMLSGCHLKMNITKAQLRLAKTGHAFAFIFSRISGERSCVGRVGMGMAVEGVETERRARASMTRAKTKITIFD
jgi:hypothetical protein